MEFILNIEPVAKCRARTKMANGSPVTYTPTKTALAQEWCYREIAKQKGDFKFSPHSPIKMEVTFYRTKSKWLKKKVFIPYLRPDLDNLTKLITDSLIPQRSTQEIRDLNRAIKDAGKAINPNPKTLARLHKRLEKAIHFARDNAIMPDDAAITTSIERKRWTDKEHGYIVITLDEDKEIL